jgi:hypothetical protein
VTVVRFESGIRRGPFLLQNRRSWNAHEIFLYRVASPDERTMSDVTSGVRDLICSLARGTSSCPFDREVGVRDWGAAPTACTLMVLLAG